MPHIFCPARDHYAPDSPCPPPDLKPNPTFPQASSTLPRTSRYPPSSPLRASLQSTSLLPETDHAAIPIVQEHLAKISTSVALVTGARAGQSPNRITKSSVLDSLLLDFKRIAGTARAIELRDGETGFAVPFNNVPHRIERDIRAYADSLLKLLEDNNAPVADGGDTPEQKTAKAALRARFLALGINPAFVTLLRTDRDALDELDKHNKTEVQEGTEDTALINAQLTLINTEVDILDPIMKNIYELQPEKLHAWQRASRVERDPQRAKKDPGEDTTPPPAGPVTPA